MPSVELVDMKTAERVSPFVSGALAHRVESGFASVQPLTASHGSLLVGASASPTIPGNYKDVSLKLLVIKEAIFEARVIT